MKFKTISILALVFPIGLLFANQCVLAQTWEQTSAPIEENWHSVASSADGTKLVAVSDSRNFSIAGDFSLDGSIYLSKDSGITWILATNAPTAAWISVCSSADGSKLAAIVAGGSIYVSNDAGVTWSPINTPSEFLDCISCSATGTKLMAGAWDDFVGQRSLIYTLWNPNWPWITDHAPAQYWTSIACSANGKNLVASCVNASDTGGVYFSKNYGVSWRRTTAPAGNWYAVASSSDGKNLAAAISGGSIYVSTNSGATWNATDVPNEPWTSMAFSADGNKLVAAANYGAPIYTSNDSGQTWMEADAPYLHWLSIASSADGNKLYAASFEDGIYTLQTDPAPQLSYIRTRKTMTISWGVPSEIFVLQQSTDNVNWNDVLTQPILGFSNLKYHITLPLAVSSSLLFRLHAP